MVPNASPYERGKDDVRLDLVQRRAREAGAALAYCNLVGGQDELVFDGDSILVSAAGELLARGPQFEEALIVADLDLPAAGHRRAERGGRRGGRHAHRDRAGDAARPPLPRPADGAAAPGRRATGRRRPAAGPFWPRLDDLAEVYAALVLGTADYVRKNGFRSVLLALSGGIDSALVATIAADAIGPENVSVILMPSRWSSGHSVTDAEDLVERQGDQRADCSIQPIVDAFRDGLADFPVPGLPAENLQSRVRGVMQHGGVQRRGAPRAHHRQQERDRHRVLHLYGDSAGGFGPIKDVPKTLVWALSRWRNAEAERLGQTAPIPPNSSASRRRPSSRPGSWTPTRCRTTRYSTRCSTTTWRRTWGRPS